MKHEILVIQNRLMTTQDLKDMEREGYEACVGTHDTVVWR